MPITALTGPMPSRATDTPAEFSDNVDLFLSQLLDFQTDANTLAENVDDLEIAAAASADAASTSEDNALIYKDIALAALNTPASSATCTSISTSAGGANSSIATVVAGGTLYATLEAGKNIVVGHHLCFADSAGTAAYIGVRTVSYNSGTGAYVGAILYSEGSGTFTAWTASLSVDPTKLVARLTPYVTTGDYAAIPGGAYIVAGVHHATLPAAPTVGDLISFKNRSGVMTTTVLRNGSLIEGLAENLTIDLELAEFVLWYSGAVYGWMIL